MEKLDPKAIWMFFFRFLGAGVFLLVFVGWFGINSIISSLVNEIAGKGTAGIGSNLTWLFLVLAIYIILAFIGAKLSYNAYKFELTADAFKKESGVIWKKYVSIPYERIQNVDIHRGILARILGLSDLMIQTAGYSGGRHGRGSEGKLPGVSQMRAEQLRDELIRRAKGAKSGV